MLAARCMVLTFACLAGLFSLVALVFGLVVIVNAFKAGIGQGLACLLLPPYSVYWGFAKLVHPRKGLILAGWLGSSVMVWAMLALFVASMPDGLAWS